MIEINRVKQQRHITHILVMDDDITIEPEDEPLDILDKICEARR